MMIILRHITTISTTYKELQLHFLRFPLLLTHTQDEIARIRKGKRGRNMLNRSGNTKDNLCFRYRFRDVFSRFRCCVYNGTGPLFVHVKHNGNMELHVSATFQKYGNMWFRLVHGLNWKSGKKNSGIYWYLFHSSPHFGPRHVIQINLLWII